MLRLHRSVALAAHIAIALVLALNLVSASSHLAFADANARYTAWENECQRVLRGPKSYATNSSHLGLYLTPDDVALTQNFSLQAQLNRQALDKGIRAGQSVSEAHLPYLAKLVPYFLGILERITPARQKAIERAIETYFKNANRYNRQENQYPPLRPSFILQEARQTLQGGKVTAGWMSSFVSRILFLQNLDFHLQHNVFRQRSIHFLLIRLAQSIDFNKNALRAQTVISVPVFNLTKPEDFFPFWMNGQSPVSVLDSPAEPYDGGDEDRWLENSSLGFFSHDIVHTYIWTELLKDVEQAAKNGMEQYFSSTPSLFRKFLTPRALPQQQVGPALFRYFLSKALSLIHHTYDPDLRFFYINYTWYIGHEPRRERPLPQLIWNLYQLETLPSNRWTRDKKGQIAHEQQSHIAKAQSEFTDRHWPFLNYLNQFGWMFPKSWIIKQNGAEIEFDRSKASTAIKDYWTNLESLSATALP